MPLLLTARSPGSAQRAVLLLKSWRPSGKGTTAVVYDFASRRLWVVFDAPRNPARWQQQVHAASSSRATAPPAAAGGSSDAADGRGPAAAAGDVGAAAVLAAAAMPIRAAGEAGGTQAQAWPSVTVAEGQGVQDEEQEEQEEEELEALAEEDDERGEEAYDVVRDPDYIPDPDMNPAGRAGVELGVGVGAGWGHRQCSAVGPG